MEKEQVKIIIDNMDISDIEKDNYWNTVVKARKNGTIVSAKNGLIVFDEMQKLTNKRLNKIINVGKIHGKSFAYYTKEELKQLRRKSK